MVKLKHLHDKGADTLSVLDKLKKAGLVLAVGAAAGNLVGCTSSADSAPVTAPYTAEAAGDSYADKLELTAEQLERATQAAKATAVARIDAMKQRISVIDPDNKQNSVYNSNDGSLWLTSDNNRTVEEPTYNYETSTNLFYITPSQAPDGLKIKLSLSSYENCYMVNEGDYEDKPCKTGETDNYSSLTFINPNSKVFTDFLLTEDEVREYLADPKTALTRASKSETFKNAQDEVVYSEFDSVTLDGATVLKPGVKADVLDALTAVTNY